MQILEMSVPDLAKNIAVHIPADAMNFLHMPSGKVYL
jgi:hypothetical protein